MTKTKTKEISAPKLTTAQKTRIAKADAKFKAASAAQKRVMIAKDVLARLAAGQYKAQQSVWVEPAKSSKLNKLGQIWEDGREIWSDADEEATSQEIADISVRDVFLADSGAQCKCCGVGAVFMSCTLLNNNTTIAGMATELHGDDDEHHPDIFDVLRGRDTGTYTNGLTKFFSLKQLQMIEAAFERGEGAVIVPFSIDPAGDRSLEQAMRFGTRYKSATKRLAAIMQNIVDNDGKFVPGDA